MKNHILIASAISLLASIALAGCNPQPTGKAVAADSQAIDPEEASGDFSRQEIAAIEAAYFIPPSNKMQAKGAFRFPVDASDGEYGTDFSHHNGVVPWDEIAQKGITFVYLKAGEGVTLADPQFKRNWSEAQKLAASGIKRGAYHFLFPGRDGKLQAGGFVKRVKDADGFLPTDLPPVIDIEWSFIRDKNGNLVLDPATKKPIDRWNQVAKADRVKILKDALGETERLTGVKPIIYTNASWWRSMIGAESELFKYDFWLAQYLRGPVVIAKPDTIVGAHTKLWQFTETAKIAGANGEPIMMDGKPWLVDANKVLGNGM